MKASQEFVIESGVTIPPKYPWVTALRRAMQQFKIGQSSRLTKATQQNHAYKIAKRIGISIQTRKVKEKDFHGWRVWRVK